MRTALQINLHPFDCRHAVHTLEHQLLRFGDQVDHITLTIDTKQNSVGRFSGAAYDECRKKLFDHIAGVQKRWGKIEVVEVDYSERALDMTRRRFFGNCTSYPERGFDGGPFHAYFYGIVQAKGRYVLHMDSDMLFGGGSQGWVAEAVDALLNNEDALFCGPLPGAPRADGSLVDRHRAFPGLTGLKAPERLPWSYPAYRFSSVSTRVFLIDMKRFDQLIGSFELPRPSFRRRLRARLFAQTPAMPAEEVMTAAMLRHGASRIDFLGTAPGMYSLHPPYRSASFYRDLPNLIARIVRDDIPTAQRGDYDINSSLFDWTEALKRRRLDKRLARALGAALQVRR